MHTHTLRSPLFMRSNDDNLVLEEQQQRLATWSGLEAKERSLVLKECQGASAGDRAAACELLERCLHPEPKQRPTMEQVLELAFFSGRAADIQLLLDNQAAVLDNQQLLRGDMQQVKSKLDTLSDELKQAQVRVLLFSHTHTHIHTHT